jgi:hypothetical protein
LWASFSSFLTEYRAGDIASIVGVVISVVGFAITLIGVFKSRSAAARAEEAAKAATQSIRQFEAVVDFSTAISVLEEIRRSQRQQQWHSLPDRYATLRKVLISVRASNPNLTEGQLLTIQSSLASLNAVEKAVEKALEGDTSPKAARLNAIISREIDGLVTVLAELKAATSGG